MSGRSASRRRYQTCEQTAGVAIGDPRRVSSSVLSAEPETGATAPAALITSEDVRRDDRGGAMALMVATEMAFWEKETRGR